MVGRCYGIGVHQIGNFDLLIQWPLTFNLILAIARSLIAAASSYLNDKTILWLGCAFYQNLSSTNAHQPCFKSHIVSVLVPIASLSHLLFMYGKYILVKIW